MGAIGALEALGPVCFGGWDTSGQPVGSPWSEFTTPKVQFAAVNEDQSKNAYGPLLEMLRDGPAMRNYDIDSMETFVALPKGRIELIIAGALSKVGGRPVWFSADQTEAWTQSNGGVKLAAVLRRNTGKLAILSRPLTPIGPVAAQLLRKRLKHSSCSSKGGLNEKRFW